MSAPSSLRLFPADDETIEGTARALRNGTLTCQDVLHACLAKIDAWEPKVHAWVVIDRESAIDQARNYDQELRSNYDRGPLHGIPLGIKDIIDVAGMPTACGAKHWAKGPAEVDAPLVAKLREAGAVILGKTVTTPYAWVDPPITRNPWNLDHTPGGSSSGSAAATATGMCLGAIGTQTGGSITRPASFCGVAGLKPSRHLMGTEGILPFAPSIDQPGPFARSVMDLCILIDTIKEFGDEKYQRQSFKPPRIGCLGGAFRDMADLAMREAIDEAVAVLIMEGAEVIKTPLPVDFEEVIAIHRLIMASEAAAFHEKRLAEIPEDYPSRITALLGEGLNHSAKDYIQAEWRRQKLFDEVIQLFEDVDILVTPAALGPAPDPGTTGNPAFNSPWSLWGLPTITFPVALSPEGVPLGIQLIGSAHILQSELFDAALWCEGVIRRAYKSRST